MAHPLRSDDRWFLIAPLLPPATPKPKGGRPRITDRAVLTGILFVLRSGIPWELLPQEMGCGSGVTCWRRLRDWQQVGVWHRLHLLLLDKLDEADRIGSDVFSGFFHPILTNLCTASRTILPEQNRRRAGHVQIVNFNLKDLTDAEFRSMANEVAPAFASVPDLFGKISLADVGKTN